jgi:hypothetical protein
VVNVAVVDIVDVTVVDVVGVTVMDVVDVTVVNVAVVGMEKANGQASPGCSPSHCSGTWMT